jgi:hypothetical protein
MPQCGTGRFCAFWGVEGARNGILWLTRLQLRIRLGADFGWSASTDLWEMREALFEDGCLRRIAPFSELLFARIFERLPERVIL